MSPSRLTLPDKRFIWSLHLSTLGHTKIEWHTKADGLRVVFWSYWFRKISLLKTVQQVQTVIINTEDVLKLLKVMPLSTSKRFCGWEPTRYYGTVSVLINERGQILYVFLPPISYHMQEDRRVSGRWKKTQFCLKCTHVNVWFMQPLNALPCV